MSREIKFVPLLIATFVCLFMLLNYYILVVSTRGNIARFLKYTTITDSLATNFVNDKLVEESTALLPSTTSFPGDVEELFAVRGDMYAACTLPKMDPFDPRIAHLIRHPKGVQCTRVQPDLTFLDHSGFIHVNSTALDELKVRKKMNVSCAYRFCRSHFPGFNEQILFTNYSALLHDVPVAMTADCAEIRCYDTAIAGEIYYNLYAFPSNESVANRKILPTNDSQLSVLFFIMDSLSTPQMKRNLPLTYKYLTKVMGSKELAGYTKLGLNSFPNAVPMLTGKRVYSPQSDMPDELNEGDGSYNQTFDHWDLIWKHFAKQGYATSYFEDATDYGMFHWLTQGFLQKPVDHFYFPYWTLLLASDLKSKSSQHCFGNEPTLKVTLDQIKRHVIQYKNRRYFLFPYYMELSHSHDNEIERGDEMLVAFFQEMFEGGYFNNTVVFFISDHGLRYSQIRATDVGKMEDCMPFYSVYFPKWFYELYPHIGRSLNANYDKLSSHFDTHETLLDIAYGSYGTDQRPAGSRGVSQLQDIPANRSCFEAGVPLVYCPCVAKTAVATSNRFVQKSARYLTDFINNLLKDYQDICMNLTLAEVTSAVRVHPALWTDITLDISLAIRTEPNNGTFEAMMRYDKNKKSIEIIGQVDRTNRYGKQSACVPIHYYKQFCYCYDYASNSTTRVVH